MNWGFRAWQAHPIVAKGKQVATAEVQMGDAGEVGLVAPQQLTVTVPAGALPEMQAKVVYNGPIKAPIKAGQHVADLVVTTGDTPPQTMPLVAEKAVGEAGFFDRLSAGFFHLF
jgi:D-alanyl-D-alanine carboxypeptidase (penicillin-binding protein 5/6)